MAYVFGDRRERRRTPACGPIGAIITPTSPSGPDIALELARSRAEQQLFGHATSAGVRVGRYLVLECIGAGGMAEGYAAYDPQLERKVALKLIRAAADDGARSQRLLREAQALARLSHPNVVAVHDAGSFPAPGSGRPVVFLAMELVRGVTLSRWLAARRRTWREVLHVAIAAGHGLAAAHAAGLVHRDFKPDNVMIDDAPEGQRPLSRVRVVDFGLSRFDRFDAAHNPTEHARDGSIAHEDGLTETGSVMGTPAYMAIEQHEGRTVDPRTDQFSYCVTLWESLCGHRPFAGSTRQEIAAEIAAGRIASPPPERDVPRWLVRTLTRGLAADADARWPDMATLLAVLEDDPDRRRRRRLVAVAGVAAIGLAPAAWFAHGLVEQATCARKGREVEGVWNEDARARLADALQHSGAAYWATTWERLEPTLDDYAERWATAREAACAADDVATDRSQACFEDRLDALAALLDALDDAEMTAVSNAIKAAQRLPSIEPCQNASALPMRVQPDPELRERVRAARMELARVRGLAAVGRYGDAALASAALTTAAEEIGWEPLIAECEYARGDMQERRHEPQAAASAYERALELAWRVGDQELAARVLTQLVFTTGSSLAQHERAQGFATMARIIVATIEPAPGLRTADLHNSLGNVARMRGEPREALEHFEKCLALRRTELPEDHPDIVVALNNLAVAQTDVGDVDASIETLAKALEVRERAVGSEHPDVILLLNNLSGSLEGAGRYDEAEAANARSIELVRRTLGERDAFMADALAQKVLLRIDRGFADDAAMADIALAISIREDALGSDHPLVVDALQIQAHAHHSRSELAAATDALSRALAIQQRQLGDDHLEVAATKFHLASVAINGGEFVRARALLEDVLATRRAKNPDNHESIGSALDQLGRAALGMGAHDEAIALHLEAIAEFELAHDRAHPTVAAALVQLARAQTASGAPLIAMATLARAREATLAAYGAKHQQVAILELAAVDALLAAAHYDEACARARAVVELRSEIDEQAGLDEARFVLATALWECGGDRVEARALAERACADPEEKPLTRRGACASWLAAHRVRTTR
jgi:tetratricopeptide (TPR) repeat protein